MDESLSIAELASVGRMALLLSDPESRRRMIAVAKGELAEAEAFKRLLYLDGPNHGWIESGREAEGMLSIFAGEGAPAIGQRVHTLPKYRMELARHGISRDDQRDLGLRMEAAVYQLESLGDPIIARFLGWYSELHDEHGNHIEPPSSTANAVA